MIRSTHGPQGEEENEFPENTAVTTPLFHGCPLPGRALEPMLCRELRQEGALSLFSGWDFVNLQGPKAPKRLAPLRPLL